MPNNRRSSMWSACQRYGVICVLVLFIAGPPSWAGEDGISASNPDSPEGCYCIGRVGNVNCDYRDEVTLADVSLLIDHLFISGVRLPNLEEANANGDPAGEISLADVMTLIDHLFITRVPLPDCPKPYNNPPETYLRGLADGDLHISSIAGHDSNTGVRMYWVAEDLVDHPYDHPSFAFEYRMYGPYSDAVYAELLSRFRRVVFMTHDGRVFKQGDGNTYNRCDTTWLPGGIREIVCDTVLIDTLVGAASFGRFDSLLCVDDTNFESDPVFNRIAASSGEGEEAWTYATGDTLYNLFADYPADSTLLANFVAWVRARDPRDPMIIDPTPDFLRVQVVQPGRERDIAIIDYAVPAGENRALSNPQKNFWSSAVTNWISNAGLSGVAEFDQSVDYKHIADFANSSALLVYLLRHKVVLAIQDAATGGSWNLENSHKAQVYNAVAVGTNMWVAARVPLGYHAITSWLSTDIATADYQYCFGAASARFPGWGGWLYDGDPYGLPRTEDFTGANSLDLSRWPNLTVDTAVLRTRYRWSGHVNYSGCEDCFPFLPYTDTAFPFLGALPQVGWVQPTGDAEVMYTYKSLYGPVHQIFPELSFDNLPVMHRLDRGYFRTVHSCFTPLAMDQAGAQQLVDSVLTWLYEGWLPEGAVKLHGISIEGGKR